MRVSQDIDPGVEGIACPCLSDSRGGGGVGRLYNTLQLRSDQPAGEEQNCWATKSK